MQNKKDRLINLIQNAVSGCARNWAEVIADHLLENGVIVPPCKVGDVVYVIFSQFRNEILECRVDEFSIQKGEMSVIVDVRYTHFDAKRHASFPFNWFGRFAFLTREEAEKALREL